MRRTTFLLAAIFGLSLVLRVVNLTNYPIGFTPDEAAFGYNAYSLLLTGKDEWGTPAFLLPFTNLKSFGDYKLPLYTFLAIPSVKLFGLNEFSTRLPNAICGSLAIVSLFLLSIRLFHSRRIALFAAFFLATSPWGIGLSRGAFEANLATLFIPLAIYAFLTRKYFSFLFLFALAFYSYHSARFLILPVIILSFIYHKYKNNTFPLITKNSLITLLLFLPGIVSLFGTGLSRAADVGIFHPTDNWQSLMTDRFIAVKSGFPNLLAKFYYAKPIPIFLSVSSNYLSYFSPQYLFSTGAGESTYGLSPNTGLLYLIELPLIFIFIYQLIKRPTPELLFILSLLLLMPLPAALTKGPGFAANRSILILPFLCAGLAVAMKSISRFTYIFTFLTLISLSGFLVSYTYQSPQQLASGMLYGRRELFTRLAQLPSSVSQIRVSRNLSESHIYVAFYSHMDPNIYQQTSQTWSSLGQSGFQFLDQTNYSLGKYHFANLSFGGDDPSTVLVGRPQDFELNYPQYFRIFSPGGDPLIQVSPLRL